MNYSERHVKTGWPFPNPETGHEIVVGPGAHGGTLFSERCFKPIGAPEPEGYSPSTAAAMIMRCTSDVPW